MLKINLLPGAARKAGPSPLQDVVRMPVVWLVAGLLVAGPVLLLWMPLQARKTELARLQRRIQELQPRKAEVDRLQGALQQLRLQQAALENLGNAANAWSRHLNVISNATPEGVWFIDLAFDEVKGLVIQGSAVGLERPPVVSVTQLVNDLAGDKDFAATFKKIEIESIKTVQEGELEIAQFTLSCALHEVAR